MTNSPHIRRTSSRDDLDYFPTPPWATRALFEVGVSANKDTIMYDPCVGKGEMLNVLNEYGTATGNDIHDHYTDTPNPEGDFLQLKELECDWIIMNPPYKAVNGFIKKSVELKPKIGFAALLRIQFLEGQRRYTEIYTDIGYPDAYFFPMRINFNKGVLLPKSNTTHAHAWFVWRSEKGVNSDGRYAHMPLDVRESCERESDYPTL